MRKKDPNRLPRREKAKSILIGTLLATTILVGGGLLYDSDALIRAVFPKDWDKQPPKSTEQVKMEKRHKAISDSLSQNSKDMFQQRKKQAENALNTFIEDSLLILPDNRTIYYQDAINEMNKRNSDPNKIKETVKKGMQKENIDKSRASRGKPLKYGQ